MNRLHAHTRMLAAAACLLLAGCGGAELPEALAGGRWQRTGRSFHSHGRQIAAAKSDRPELLRQEYPLVSIEDDVYRDTNTEVTVSVRVYRFASADDAYGMFSYLAPAEPVKVDAGDAAFRMGVVMVALRGERIIRAQPARGGIAEDALADFLADVSLRFPPGTPPALASLLPTLGVTTERNPLVRYGRSMLTAARWVQPEFAGQLGLSDATRYACMYLYANGKHMTLFAAEYPAGAAAETARTNIAAVLAAQAPGSRVWGEGRIAVLYYPSAAVD